MNNKNVSVIIPNLNGMEYLPKCILFLFRAFEVYPADYEIIVVDNGSTDGSVEWLRAYYPTVKLIKMGRNTGFAGACNEGVKQSKNDIVVLLNNDTFVQEGFLEPLTRHFANDELLFAVSCRLVDWHTGKFQVGRRLFIFDRGIVNLADDKEDSCSLSCLADCITGSACGISREKYLQLGGFGPFHRWNDVDFSYRAQKRRWRIIYEPESVVYHLGMATDKKVWALDEIELIWRKEMFLVVWRNITDSRFMLKHALSLPLLFRRYGPRRTTVGLIRATKELPAVLRFRAQERPHLILTDAQILQGMPAGGTEV